MYQVLDDILPRVTKPARYTGGEFNAVVKSHADVKVRFALAFPDTYEIGMSNLGLRILYHILNRRGDTAAERVFAPWVDMEAEMREHSLPLFSLETRTPLREFDVVGFSLGYELTYTNVLNMLDLAGIPVRSADRGDESPLIIAGGCCAYNPEPMAEFMDAFVIGEGEEIVHEIVDAVNESGSAGKQLLLRRLARVPGVYVPGLYKVSYNDGGAVRRVEPTESGVPEVVTKRLVWDIDSADYPDRPIVPFIEAVHDRIPLEIMRGCSRGCRFCQAGIVYRPTRQRSAEKLTQLADTLVESTGYDEISLISLSAADYRGIENLVRGVIGRYEPWKVGVSLPSIRADAPCVELAAEIQKVRKSSLTVAPEAGTQRMRDVIDKNVTEDDLLSAVEAAFRFGWRKIKLYFMIGLPTETDEDVRAIAKLASKVARIGRRMGPKLSVNISVACFVPKPHTPFQWRAQDTIEELERKQALVRYTNTDRAISLSWHEAKASALEAALARGDRRVGDAIHLAWKSGCRFDAWHEHFDYEKWVQAFRGIGLDPTFYAGRKRDYDELLPWEHVDCGVSKDFLMKEDMRADEGEITRDCRQDKCMGCGLTRILPRGEEPDVACSGKT